MTPVPDTVRERRITSRDGTGLRVIEAGRPGERTVLMLHGLRSYAETWLPLIGGLPRSWHRVAYDARGRGGSDRDPRGEYTTERNLDDLAAVLDALDVDTVDLVGHSMGGTTALLHAARHPERVARLVVEDMVPGASLSGPGADRIRRELAEVPADFADPAEAAAFWRRLRPRADDEAIASRVRYTVRDEPDPVTGRFGWIADMAGIAAARLRPGTIPDLWPAVRALTVRTMLICGSESDFSPAPARDRVAAANPAIRVRVVPGAGHYVHDDRPDSFATLVHEALEVHR
ncbi:alpha/beta hydrolase [Pseudonocardia kongjuensis]|uniref:Alpha/beta hydrolase n=1 Tax=Pseudonocardia kongjuensis TaxID=102227 RepID=A0ABN1Y8V5_9PSEU